MRSSLMLAACALLIWLVLIIAVGWRHPMFLVVSALPWYLGVRLGGTTSIPYDPTDSFSPKVRLSPKGYDRWAKDLLSSERQTMRVLLNPNVSYHNKFSLQFSIWSALMHIYSWILVLVILIPLDWMLALYLLSAPFGKAITAASEAGAGFGITAAIVIGHLGGWALGLYRRTVRALLV